MKAGIGIGIIGGISGNETKCRLCFEQCEITEHRELTWIMLSIKETLKWSTTSDDCGQIISSAAKLTDKVGRYLKVVFLFTC